MTDRIPSFDLRGKLALVTGGASGIGAGIALVLAEAGATVVIADRDETGARREAAALTQAGHKAGAVHIDLADEASIVSGCAAVVSGHGTPWALVNNAGLQHREALLDVSLDNWNRGLQAVLDRAAGSPGGVRPAQLPARIAEVS